MSRKLAVLDLETDPFDGHEVSPFLSGFYDGSKFTTIWDEENCIIRTVDMLTREHNQLIIYAHNGGKFDWCFFLPYLTNGTSLRVINSRIVQAQLGEHEIRDSYAIMPFPLAAYRKDDIDYQKLHKSRRTSNKDEIINYLYTDCLALYELVTAYWDEFGDVLTIGAAGMKELRRFHPFQSGGPTLDEKFRKSYYFGGRVQVFRKGIVHEPVKVADVNSMYAFVMKTHLHPISTTWDVSKYIEKNTCFVTATGWSDGAFPVRNDKGGIDFPIGFGTYNTTIYEWEAALDTNCFRPDKIIKTYSFKKRICFDLFVDHFYKARLKAKASGDAIHTLFYKYALNAPYGKFAQNPLHYFDYQITHMERLGEPWEPTAIYQGKYILWRKPANMSTYYNVCTAASITGGARAVLLRGLHHVRGLCYCDTDSIIASNLGTLEISDSQLGKWKLEGSFKGAAFAGKKMYSLFRETPQEKNKCASKGVRLTASEIYRIARGRTITYHNPVPHFTLSGEQKFVSRRVRATT